jgi:cytoskeletal protein CcmA (bactofilin family)
MIFRRENRGESFQRQINNLRQQQSEAPPDDEEQQQSYESSDYDYEAEESSDTSRYATDQGTPGEGISFPSSRSEPSAAEQAPDETAISSPPQQPAEGFHETRQWQSPSASRIPSTPQGDSSTSTIAQNAYWNGTLKSEGSLHVFGKADGELHSDTDLYVAEGAEVDASLHADSVVVAGLVRGKIEARSRLEVLPQGEVTGDVRSPKLVVHEGATISGQLKMEEVGASSSGSPRLSGSES